MPAIKLTIIIALFLFTSLSARAADCPIEPGHTSQWQEVLKTACKQRVNFHAWGGKESINDYIAWAAKEIKDRYGVELHHVKISNTADSVQQVLAAKTANKESDGAIDLIWINGANFRKMKQEGLLYGPFANDLPHFKYVDVKGKPTTIVDFTVPTEGYESPWGMAQLVFIYDSAHVKMLPTTMRDFLVIAKTNKGRVTYPAPPDFLGMTFIKQALLEVSKHPEKFQKAPDANAAKLTKPLWQYLDTLHPNMWQGGKNFPKDWPAQNQLLADGEVHFSLAFNPNDASADIAREVLPETIRTFVMKNGSIGNTHFVAIPYNSSSSAGARVVANFLLSPQAQSHKANPNIWGDPTVLALKKLPNARRKDFETLPKGIATLAPEDLGKVLPEPHPDWNNYLQEEWIKRYGS